MEPNVKYLKTLGFKIGTKEKIQFHWCDGFLNYMTILGQFSKSISSVFCNQTESFHKKLRFWVIRITLEHYKIVILSLTH